MKTKKAKAEKKILQVYLSSDEAAQIAALADEMGLGVSTLLRLKIKELLSTYNAQKEQEAQSGAKNNKK